MSSVIFDGKKIIPAPFVGINKQYNRVGEGEILGVTYTLTIRGILLEDRGSPDSTGQFWTMPGYPPNEDIPEESKLGSLLRKQKAIRNLFSAENDGKLLEIQSADGSQPLKCNPKIVSIDFPEDLWNTRSDYVITLTADRLYPFTDDNESPFISEASETWTIEPEEEREEINSDYNLIYRVTHTISAQGKRIYNELGELEKEPWEWAKDWVTNRSGYDNNLILESEQGITPDHSPYNYSKSEIIDKFTGQYSLSEIWTVAMGKAIEQYEISLTKNIESYINTVSIQGTIRGLEERDSDYNIITKKIDNAENKFDEIKDDIYIRCQSHLATFGNGILHTDPKQEVIGKSPANGTINYSFEFDNRPSGLIPGAISELINVNYIEQGQSFASVFVLGRRHGPVLQDLGTSEARQKTLTIEFVREGGIDPLNIADSFKFPDHLIDTLVYNLDPIRADNAVQSFSGQPNKSYDPYNGRGSYSINWTYEK